MWLKGGFRYFPKHISIEIANRDMILLHKINVTSKGSFVISCCYYIQSFLAMISV